jgi:hypothetical protein
MYSRFLPHTHRHTHSLRVRTDSGGSKTTEEKRIEIQHAFGRDYYWYVDLILGSVSVGGSHPKDIIRD